MNSKSSALSKHTGTASIIDHSSRLALVISLIWFSGISANLSAGEHNEQHVAEMAAQNAVFDAGCTRTNITRSSRFQVTQDGDHYIVTGNSLKVECVSTEKKTMYSITWSAPTVRVDGTKLESSELAGYQLLRDGKIVDMSPCCEFMTTDPEGLFIRAVDSEGLVSQSVPVTM